LRGFDFAKILFILMVVLLMCLVEFLHYCAVAVAWWLWHYATNRKVAGSVPDEVIFFKFT
jgi:hypothetical protein